MPAMNETVRLTIAPINAAVSANKRRSGLSGWVRTLVCPGAARMAVKAESTPARVQVNVEVRRTQTPDNRAESAFSDMARMARPQGENLMKAARARATTGATIRVRTSPGLKTKPSTVNVQWIGTGNGRERFFGRMKGSAVNTNRTWERPMVATMTSTRGRLNNRRSNSSESAPMAAARARARTSENQ